MNAPVRWGQGSRLVILLALASLAAGPPPSTPRRASAYARPRSPAANPAAAAPQLDRLNAFGRRVLYGPDLAPTGLYPSTPRPDPAPPPPPVHRTLSSYYGGLRPGQHAAYPVGHAHCTPSRMALVGARGY